MGASVTRHRPKPAAVAMTDLSGPAILLLSVAATALGMAVLAEWPRAVPCLLMGVIPACVSAVVYVCGDEAGFLSDTYVGKLLYNRDKMQAGKDDPKLSTSPWWEDG